MFGKTTCGFVLTTLLTTASPLLALDSGKAIGTLTVDGSVMPLVFAVQTKIENLFDDKKQDTLIVLSDRALGATAPDDEIEISMRARKGEMAVLALRIDGNKLVNVTISHKGLSGVSKLPGAWFQFAAAKVGVGTLKLDKRSVEDHAYAASVEFSAAVAQKPAPVAAPTPATPVPAPRATTTAAPAPAPTTDSKAAVAALVQALMRGNEYQALEVIRGGIDPNGRDESGIPVLNWAIMVCQPSVVQALVNLKADLKYQRAPGLTPLMEAGACPAAEKILRAAGAR